MIALLSIMVQSEAAVETVNSYLHAYRDCVLGRMGLPIREKGLSVISVVLDTDSGKINALTGKLGGIEGVRAKAMYSVGDM